MPLSMRSAVVKSGCCVLANADFNVNFKGINKLFDEFDKAGPTAIRYTEDAMKTSLARAAEKSKRLARVDTGYMKNNIIPDPVHTNNGTVVGSYTARAEYSSFNEYGTYKMSAQPFMRPGVQAETSFFYKAVKDALAKNKFG